MFRQLVNFSKVFVKQKLDNGTLNLNVSYKQIWDKSKNQITKQCSTEVAEDFPDIVKALLAREQSGVQRTRVRKLSYAKLYANHKNRQHLISLAVVNRMLNSILKLALYHLKHHEFIDVNLVSRRCRELIYNIMNHSEILTSRLMLNR